MRVSTNEAEKGGGDKSGVGSARVFQLHDRPGMAVTDEACLGSLVRHRREHSSLAQTETKDRELLNQDEDAAKQ